MTDDFPDRTDHDPVYFWNILHWGHAAVDLTAGRRVEDLARDREFRLRLGYLLTQVGVSASKVSALTRWTLPALPWDWFIETADELLASEHEPDQMLLWRTVTEILPPFLVELESAIEDEIV